MALRVLEGVRLVKAGGAARDGEEVLDAEGLDDLARALEEAAHAAYTKEEERRGERCVWEADERGRCMRALRTVQHLPS